MSKCKRSFDNKKTEAFVLTQKQSVPELVSLVEKWKRIAAIKFEHAKGEETDFGKRFIEHGAVCYFNCANELEQLIKTGDSAPDLKL